MINVSEADTFKAFEGLPSSLNTKEDINYDDKINRAVDRILADQAN